MAIFHFLSDWFIFIIFPSSIKCLGKKKKKRYSTSKVTATKFFWTHNPFRTIAPSLSSYRTSENRFCCRWVKKKVVWNGFNISFKLVFRTPWTSKWSILEFSLDPILLNQFCLLPMFLFVPYLLSRLPQLYYSFPYDNKLPWK